MWSGHFVGRFKDKYGKVIEEFDIPNNLADEGEQAILDVFFRNGTAPTNFYMRLFNDTPVDTDTLTDLTGEASGSGYAAGTLARSGVGWPTLALANGDYEVTSDTITFTASGGSIGPVTYMVLATSTDTSGKLIAYAALSQSRTLADGESLDVTYKAKLS